MRVGGPSNTSAGIFTLCATAPPGVFVGAQVPAVSNWRPQHGVTEYSVSGISPRHAGQPGLLSLQPHGVVCDLLHGLFRRPDRSARGDERSRLRRLRPGARRCRHLSGQRQVEQQLQSHGSHQPGGQVCHSFDAEANGYMRSEGSFVFAIKPLGGGRAGRRPDLRRDRGDRRSTRQATGRRYSRASRPAVSSAHPPTIRPGGC